MISSPGVSLRSFDATPPRRGAWAAFFALALGIFVADQASKWGALAALTDAMQGASDGACSWAGLERFLWREHPGRRAAITVVADFFHLRYVENPGAAWGFLSGSAAAWRTPFFLTVSLGAMGFILKQFRSSHATQPLMRVALACVFGGALGNFVDRVRLGYVIDFIDWHLGEAFTWPTFNVADAAISVGVIVLIATMLFDNSSPSRSPRLSV